jgi:hypothetical protein
VRCCSYEDDYRSREECALILARNGADINATDDVRRQFDYIVNNVISLHPCYTETNDCFAICAKTRQFIYETTER